MQPFIMETASAVINKQKKFSMLETIVNTTSIGELIFSLEYFDKLEIVPEKDKLKFNIELDNNLMDMPDELTNTLKVEWSKTKLEELIQEAAYDQLDDQQKEMINSSTLHNIIGNIEEDDEDDEDEDDCELKDFNKLTIKEIILLAALRGIFGEKNVKVLDFEDLKEYDFIITAEKVALTKREIETLLEMITISKFKAFTICADYPEDDIDGEVATGVRIIIAINS